MTTTVLYHKASVLMGQLEDSEASLPEWKRKLIYDYLEEAQKIIGLEDRRGGHVRRANHVSRG